MSLGALYVVSGPSGAGKSTVCKAPKDIIPPHVYWKIFQ